VRVKPRASREALEGEAGGALVVRLTAPPVEGEANAALARLVARTLGVPPSAVAVARGAKARDKVLVVSGLGPEDVRARVSAALAAQSARASR
jgi:uncharacterized protein YggU (UPF0235/DUF167 family)